MRIALLVTVVLPLVAPATRAQTAPDVAALLKQPQVRAALDAARASEAATIQDQIRICEIPAPPFMEAARAKAYAEMLRGAGLMNVRLDGVGNVLGERPGRAARPHLVLSAHLDTVFPEGTDVRVKREGTILRAPGIGDDCRGLAVLLAVARALDAGKVLTEGPITFVGTVGEEGLGDLRGVKALFATTLEDRIDRFVSVDDTGHTITHVSVGSHRYRVTFRGPGGHSYDRFGIANPTHALGRAIAAIGDLQVPAEPKTTFNVGRTGGGTSINAIAQEAWMEIDLRSSDPAALRRLDARFQQAVQQALTAENARWKQAGALKVEIQQVGNRPAGRVAADAPIVQIALATATVLGLTAPLVESSTDANVPMNLGIPAITVGGGGRVSGAHSLEEAYDTTDSWLGTQRLTLLAVALAR